MCRKVAVAISGGGRSLQNLIVQQNHFGYEIAAVISSSKSCLGNIIAEKHGLPLMVGSFHEDISLELSEFLGKNDISWIALAGFLKKFPILPGYENKILNIHPALLPLFGGQGMYGMNVHRRVKESGHNVSGPTIHFVSDRYDEGQIIAQKIIDIAEEDNAQNIADRVFEQECILYPRVLGFLVSNFDYDGPFPIEINEA